MGFWTDKKHVRGIFPWGHSSKLEPFRGGGGKVLEGMDSKLDILAKECLFDFFCEVSPPLEGA